MLNYVLRPETNVELIFEAWQDRIGHAPARGVTHWHGRAVNFGLCISGNTALNDDYRPQADLLLYR